MEGGLLLASRPFSIKILSDGTYKLDGGSVFGPVPKVIWDEKVSSDRKNRIRMGLNCLLLQNDSINILIDTGVGTKEPLRLKEFYGLSSGRLVRQLKTEGLTPKDISAVVLSHLHFDHAGGATRLDRSGSQHGVMRSIQMNVHAEATMRMISTP